ncbi:MAG: ABC transporter ATP-binding protein [Betaproteobacteria bacterium]
MNQNVSLRLSEVRKSFGSTSIINGVSLDVFEGERHAIIGPNGAGKSTLFNLISGRYGLSAGRIELKGQDITNLDPQNINRSGLSRSFQITNIFPKMSVYENIRCATLWSLGYRYSLFRRISTIRSVRKRADEIIELIGLGDRGEKLAGELTYAEQRALEIGITIASGSDVILLDEPTAGMSRVETNAAVELISKVTTQKTLLMVEHDMGVVFDLADRISVLVYGEIIATGSPSEIRSNQLVKDAYLGTQEGVH